MVSQAQISMAVVGVYVLILLVLGYISFRKRDIGDLEEYFLVGRNMGPAIGILTVFATYQSGYFIFGNVGFFYLMGYPWLLASLGLSPLVVIFMWYFGSRFWVLGKKFGHITLPRIFADYYQSDSLRVVVALLHLLFLIPYIVLQTLAGGLALEGITQGVVAFEWGVVFMAVIITVYTVMGGFRAVTWTDSLQGVFFFLTMWVIMAYFLVQSGGIGGFFTDYAGQFPSGLTYTGLIGIDPVTLHLALFLAFVVGFAFQPEFNRRLIAAKDLKTLRTVAVGTGVIVFLGYLATMFVGLGIKMSMPGIENPDSALPVWLGTQFPLIGSFVIAAAVAAMMSTADSLLCSIASTIVDDIYRPFYEPDASGERLEKVGWVVIVFSMVIATIVTLLEPGFIVEIAAVAYTGFLPLFWLTIGMFYWDGASSEGGIAALVVGAIAAYALKYGDLGAPVLVSGFSFAIYTFVITGVVFVAVSLVTDPVPQEKRDEYSELFERYGPRTEEEAPEPEPSPAD